MKKSLQLISLIVLIAASAITSYADDNVLPARIDSIMSQAAQNDNYHITAKQLNNWMKMKKDDFLVVDIRFAPKDSSWVSRSTAVSPVLFIFPTANCLNRRI